MLSARIYYDIIADGQAIVHILRWKYSNLSSDECQKKH